MKVIELSHGGGGAETQQLIEQLFFKYFANDILLRAEDAALVSLSGQLAFTTDSYTVTPLFFNGGNIGNLAVAGTLNDLAMRGAQPLYLSCAFIIEEGLPYATLEQVVQTMAMEIERAGVKVVCGDTKVVPKGSVDQLFINTSGIGQVLPGIKPPSAHNVLLDDAIIVSRDIGRHGAVVMAERQNLWVDENLQSDCQNVWPAVQALLANGLQIHALRDATRGGLAEVLNEWVESSSQICLEIDESALPICEPVQGICELLGFEAYDFANEGTFVMSLPASQAQSALEVLAQFDFCESPAVIGRVTELQAGKVILNSAWGSQRILERPKGELLPRIC